jgi:hypothetical protein
VRAALGIGLLAVALSELTAAIAWPGFSDFVDPWLGARALLHGDNPYAVVWAAHPGVPLYYPLPGLLLIAPLAILPRIHAEAIFTGLGVGALAYAGWGSPLIVACLSASLLASIAMGQWTPLLTASALLPSLGFVWACKPSIGLGVALGYGNRRSFYLALGATSLAVLLWPGWVQTWLASLQGSPYVMPIRRPGGALLLLALLRWRRPEGRLLAGLACIPQLGMLYETVPLFLIPRSRWDAYGLAISTHLAGLLMYLHRDTGLPLVDELTRQWPIMLILVYLPALILVLLDKPVWPQIAERASWRSRLAQRDTPPDAADESRLNSRA